MSGAQLSDFLNRLADRGELTRVGATVNRRFELAAIVQRAVTENAGPALLFEDVAGSSIPVVAGLLGTERRMLHALKATSLDEVADRITALVRPDLPTGMLETLRLLPKFAEVSQWPPRVAATALAQQVVHMGSDVDLATLPIPICWPGETHPTLTAAQLLIEVPVEGAEATEGAESDALPRRVRRVLSRVPVQILDRNTVLIHWTAHDEGWRLVNDAVRSGRQLPIAIALGGDPLLTLAASVPLPPYADRLTFAGFLRQCSVALVAGRSIDTLVPGDAEIILECLVNPERAFADAPPVAAATGFLIGTQPAVVATVTALTHRANPVLPVIVPGRPLGEEGVIARAIERLLLPLVRLAIPELLDLRLPDSGAHRHIGFASIRKTFPMQARQVMNALWGLTRLSTIKLLVVVDADVDVRNDADVWRAVGAHSHPGRDTIFSEGPADMLDHAAPVRGVGHRIGIDATRKSASEGHQREWPADLKTDAETARLVSQRWQQYGINVPGDSTR